MSTPRVRLYQYPHSPYCIPLRLMLEHGHIPHTLVNLPYGNPQQIIELTKGDYYSVPVLEDLRTQAVIFESGPETLDVAQYAAQLMPALNLFREDVRGVHEILIRYIENECEAVGFKICDAHSETWLRGNLERGLMRRHKERKFGPGCVEQWKAQLPQLTKQFYELLLPLEAMLKRNPFLLGDTPVYADYALAGVLGNFLHPTGRTELPPDLIHLGAWHSRMVRGDIPNALDATQLAAADQFGENAANYGKSHILADTADVAAAVAGLNLGRGRKVLDVACGAGHTGLYLAAQGLDVTMADLAYPMLEQTAALANESQLHVTLKQHSAEELPYPDASFDLVTCRVAAHHFSDPQAFVREATRVLRPYGHLLVIDGTVSDDQLEAEAWIHQIEVLRDPTHVKFITPRAWQKWSVAAGLKVVKSEIQPMQMPDLNWYFKTANTPVENQKRVLELIAQTPQSARDLFKVAMENGKITWWWQRLTFLAGKL